MGRSVVLAGAARCPCCSLPPRRCTCNMVPPVETQLAVHVLIHRHESHKPSSTGRLVARAVRGAVAHIYQRETKFFPATTFTEDTREPTRELWILHPNGQPLPSPADSGDAPSNPCRHILLLDGTWRQAGEMLRTVEGLGRCVRLPNVGDEPSRYWLRDQPGPGQLSTAEAMIAVFRAVGDHEAAHRLRLHFELHVYATLLARGKKEMAERYLGHSPLLTDAPEALAKLHAPRARGASAPSEISRGEAREGHGRHDPDRGQPPLP